MGLSRAEYAASPSAGAALHSGLFYQAQRHEAAADCAAQYAVSQVEPGSVANLADVVFHVRPRAPTKRLDEERSPVQFRGNHREKTRGVRVSSSAPAV